MRLSALAGKEIINIGDGVRLGSVDGCELAFDEKSGRIHSLLLPPKAAFISFFRDDRPIVINWHSIRKFGEEVIVVEV